ncbi:hypothetical protein [Intestinimonas butyriciproducens]|uniref:hypothetical protein n=1 Tax=Intestinimonas butyriciproducens TaxID=1297617 RepID=UPI00242F9114|nr:hypothetical protein [Intestinimonas butyriciproducens]MCI6362052.1 hypothetical protein [Intestinimonas butyriciproducens]MDY3615280.1 hypothetical protein [Intestinimonas butyriciproducens]
MDKKIWYAVMRDRDDIDWGYGSFILDEAKSMALNLGVNAYIATIDVSSNDPICIEEIEQENF